MTYDSEQTCECESTQYTAGTAFCSKWVCNGKLTEKDIACFSLDTRVPTPHGMILLRDIVPGDEVYSLDLDTGKVVTDTVYDLFHYEPELSVNTLKFTLSNEVEFWISRRHLMILNNGTSIFAENVHVGDHLRSPFQSCSMDDNRVVRIERETKIGFVAPATSTGTILVGDHYNAVAVSVYAEFEYHLLSHYWSWPLRMYRYLFGYPKRAIGMNSYASLSMDVLEKKVLDITPIIN